MADDLTSLTKELHDAGCFDGLTDSDLSLDAIGAPDLVFDEGPISLDDLPLYYSPNLWKGPESDVAMDERKKPVPGLGITIDEKKSKMVQMQQGEVTGTSDVTQKADEIELALSNQKNLATLWMCYKLAASGSGDLLEPEEVTQMMDSLLVYMQSKNNEQLLSETRRVSGSIKKILPSTIPVDDVVNDEMNRTFQNLHDLFKVEIRKMEIQAGKRALQETNTPAVENAPNKARLKPLKMERVEEIIAQFGNSQDVAALNLDASRPSLSRFVKDKLKIEPWPGKPSKGNTLVHARRLDCDVHHHHVFEHPYDTPNFDLLLKNLSKWIDNIQADYHIEYIWEGNRKSIKDNLSWSDCVSRQRDTFRSKCIRILLVRNRGLKPQPQDEPKPQAKPQYQPKHQPQ